MNFKMLVYFAKNRNHVVMSKKKYTLLVVDDDSSFCESFKFVVPDNWAVFCATSANHVHENQTFSAAFVDMHLADTKDRQPDGPKVIERLLEINPKIQIVAMSGDLRMDLMESCLKAGAQRFISKPVNPQEVVAILGKIEAFHEMNEETDKESVSWIGSSLFSKQIKYDIANLRDEKSHILIEGETGTGKEVVASLLSRQEKGGHIVTVNAASIPVDLFESEFFGHVEGAFTGAKSSKKGLAELADGGDLFLDEVNSIPLNFQAKLLRFLENGEIRRVGSNTPIFVKVRVISATNSSLEKLVKEGKFREDLYFRLNGNRINLLPLRYRKEDIEDLANHFMNSLRPQLCKVISKEAMSVLMDYDFPGNVRELKRICERLALYSPLPIIRKEDVEELFLVSKRNNESPNIGDGFFFSYSNLHLGLESILSLCEESVINATMKKYKNIEEAIKVLKVSRSSFYKKMKEYGIKS